MFNQGSALNMSEFTTGLLTSGNSEHAQEPLVLVAQDKAFASCHRPVTGGS